MNYMCDFSCCCSWVFKRDTDCFSCYDDSIFLDRLLRYFSFACNVDDSWSTIPWIVYAISLFFYYSIISFSFWMLCSDSSLIFCFYILKDSPSWFDCSNWDWSFLASFERLYFIVSTFTFSSSNIMILYSREEWVNTRECF